MPSLPTSKASANDPAELLVTSLERELFERINQERTARHLAPVSLDGNLVLAARAHSREMSDLRYFAHISPTPGLRLPVDRFLRVIRERGKAPPPNVLVAENICHITELSPEKWAEVAHRALMESPEHRATILSPTYVKAGVGVYPTTHGEVWATQMFLRDTAW